MTAALISQDAINDLKARQSCATLAGKYVKLRRHGKKLIGPCPICSRDRQSNIATKFECDSEGWVCAVCPDGGDVIKLAMKVEGLDFPAAFDWLDGKREVDPEHAKQLADDRAAKDAKREREADYYRDRKRRECWDIWTRAEELPDSAAEAYLRARGICELPAMPRLKCAPLLPYFVNDGPNAKVIHRGPAMVAPIMRPDGRFGGIHRTYIDLAQPKGKLALTDPDTGELLEAKKALGSKKGGYIDLVRVEDPRRLIIGEGIEKVLAVWLALSRLGRDLSRTMFRTAIDLGNLGGAALKPTLAHPTLRTEKTNRPRFVSGPIADLSEPGIPVPESVEEIVILGDSTSDLFLTECAIARAAERWAKPGARAVLVAWSPAGKDFDDLLREAA